MTDKALRLYPLPTREINAGSIYEDLELPPTERHGLSKPYVVINMVSSLDGRVAVEGRASRLGSETDRRVMRTLRSKADAVMIGANTLRAEKLSLGLDGSAGDAQPLAVILTNTGDVPLESHLIRDERQEVLVLVPKDCPPGTVNQLLRHRAHVLRAPTTPGGYIDLEEALKILRADYAVDLLVTEGGPTLNYALISRELADELFLTLAPKLIGGTPGAILPNSHLPAARNLHLFSLHAVEDELFLRYGIDDCMSEVVSYNTTSANEPNEHTQSSPQGE